MINDLFLLRHNPVTHINLTYRHETTSVCMQTIVVVFLIAII